jgi:hypothetical protein
VNPLLKIAAELGGVPDSTIEEVEKTAPAMARLMRAAKQLQPILVKAQPLIDETEPIVRAAYPDFVACLPTAEDIIAFIVSKGVIQP